MLVLLRQNPDQRLREVISALPWDHPSSHMVYLEQALSGQEGPPPFVIFGKTSAFDPTADPSIAAIDATRLLCLIRDNPDILVLP